jgi:hypothetical protein
VVYFPAGSFDWRGHLSGVVVEEILRGTISWHAHSRYQMLTVHAGQEGRIDQMSMHISRLK